MPGCRPALCNTAGRRKGPVHDLKGDRAPDPEKRVWVVSCDKIRLMWNVGPDLDPVGVLPLPYKSTEYKGRHRGQFQTFVTPLTFPGMGGETIWGQMRRYEGQSTREVRLEFNPNKQGPLGLRCIGAFVRMMRLDPLAAYVERCDVASDLAECPRHWFRLDPGMHQPDYFGITRRGPQTERVGKGKVSIKLYDKRAERMDNAGVDLGHELLRHEVEAWAPYFRVDEPGGEAADLRLRDLHLLRLPSLPDVCVREFMHDPEEYADQRYFALACVAHCYGSRAAETCARSILSGDRPAAVDQLRWLAWPEVSPSPVAAFEGQWAAVVERMREDLMAASEAIVAA